MGAQRVKRLCEQAGQEGLDCIALVPGANLFHLTGLSFRLSERPVVALLPVDGPPAMVLPALEAPKLEEAAGEIQGYPYSDAQGPALAFQQACAALELAEARIGVEGLRMRLMEARYLERYAPGSQLIPADEVMEGLRVCKDAGELARIRQAVAVVEAALWTAFRQLRAGMTEREAAGLLAVEILRAGAEGLPFSPIVAAGPNAASPHAAPSARPIRSGDAIVVDCGAAVGGYVSDITRTFVAGKPTGELLQVHQAVLNGNAAGQAKAGPGVAAQEVDRAARLAITSAGYGTGFTHRTGHGLGLEEHEPPYIVEGNRQPLRPGMTFTVEPGVYLPGAGGVRIEDDLVITSGGAECLTTFPRELMALESLPQV